MSLDTTRLGPRSWEREYLTQIFEHLPGVPAIAFHGRWIKGQPPKPPTIDPSGVLVMVSDEFCRPSPPVTCKLLCRQYHVADHSFPLPLGIKSGFPLQPIRRMEQRPYDLVFVGNGHAGRRQIVDALTAHPQISQLKTYLSCDKVPLATYAELLYNAKVVLSPRGLASPECFRWFEAVRCGCVTVQPQLPDNWIYAAAPGVTVHPFNVKHSETIAQAVLQLLARPVELQSRSDAAVAFWQSRLQPRVVAERIRQQLKKNP
jgi:hypothetical protein